MEYASMLTNRLLELVNTPSPTGFTHLAKDYLVRTLTQMGYAPTVTRKGNVLCALGGEGDALVVSAHVDTLGAVVRSIKGNGHIRLQAVGGYPFNYIENENCRVFTRDGRSYTGTVYIQDPSVHVNREAGSTKRDDKTMDFVLDELVYTKEDVEKLGIANGCFVALDPRAVRTDSGFIKSRHLDDKASSSVLLALAQLVQEQALCLRRKVYILFTMHEEVGHGASAGIPADATEILAVDMGCVGEDLSCDETMVSICAKDSHGPYSYEVVCRLEALAKAEQLDYAVDIYPSYGSDTAAALTAGNDILFGLIGPGVFASHGYERTHEKGLVNTLRLLMAYVSNKN